MEYLSLSLPVRAVLSEGAAGPSVQLLQTVLTILAMRYRNLTAPGVTGVYGAPTARAVARVQQAAGLSPTGTTDEATWKCLAGLYRMCDRR